MWLPSFLGLIQTSPLYNTNECSYTVNMIYAPNPENKIKTYVGVTATFSPEGKIRPLSVEWEDGTLYEIDDVIRVRQAPSFRGGGIGLRFTIRVGTKETCLWFERDKWFVERRV